MLLTSGESGKTPSFFSSTIDSRAARSANSRCFAQSFTSYGIDAKGTHSGGSNRPRRMRAVSSLFSAVSTSETVNRPCSTA